MFNVKLDLVDVDTILKERGLEPGGAVQRFIDSEVIRLSEPYVPMDTHKLLESAPESTDYGSGLVVYQTPYAKKMYTSPELNFQGAPMRGAYWAERMAADHIDDLVEGAAKIAGGRAK